MERWIIRWAITLNLNDNFILCPWIKEASLYKGSIDTLSSLPVGWRYPYKADKYNSWVCFCKSGLCYQVQFRRNVLWEIKDKITFLVIFPFPKIREQIKKGRRGFYSTPDSGALASASFVFVYCLFFLSYKHRWMEKSLSISK